MIYGRPELSKIKRPNIRGNDDDNDDDGDDNSESGATQLPLFYLIICSSLHIGRNSVRYGNVGPFE